LKKSIKALKFTPRYDDVEDRIRLSINYDDLKNRVDFMITRALVLKLFPMYDEYMLKFYNQDLSMREIGNERDTSNNDSGDNIKKNYGNLKKNNATSKTDQTDLKLYAGQDELLVEVVFSYDTKSNLSIIRFRSKQSEAVAQLDADLLEQVFNIIRSAIPSFSWGISHNF